MIARYGVDRNKKKADRWADSEIEKFKIVAQKIDLDLNAGEFKGGSFLRGIQDPDVKSVGLIPLPIAQMVE